MRRTENYILNFLTAVPIVWICLCYLFYLLEFNPRVFGGETLDEYLLYWFLRYYVYIGIPLWIVLMVYKGLRQHFTNRAYFTHLLVFIVGATILVLMMLYNPDGWTGRYFD